MKILFDQNDIAREVTRLAREIASRQPRVELAVPILTGAFVFAADLIRALTREGLDLQVECISLTRYTNTRRGMDDIVVRMGAGDTMLDRHILLIDGVLDNGHTLVHARTLLREAGASSVAIAVAVDKARQGALVKPDYAAFSGVDDFIVGYGMDDAGHGRGLPHIAAVE